MNLGRPHLLGVVLITAAALLPACDGTRPTDPLAGRPPWAGDWQGLSGQGKAVSFTVGGTAEAPALTAGALAIEIDELSQNTGSATCLGAEATASNDGASLPIVNGEFVLEILGVGALAGASFRFEGAFDSPISASGQLMAETSPNSVCQGRGVTSWTAERA